MGREGRETEREWKGSERTQKHVHTLKRTIVKFGMGQEKNSEATKGGGGGEKKERA